MRERADKPRTARQGRDYSVYGLVVGAVVLGWQMAMQPLMQRAPVEAAVRLAPGSPTVLRRAAESELAAGRVDNAAALSREALTRSPFDVRALRVFGLTEAQAGREGAADEILTLAGNWSLRDDPAHAWLVERRLRRGDYASAFAHADTLVRRRQDIQPQVFQLFTVAGTTNPQRSVPEIASLLAARPPWRSAYLYSLEESPQDLQLYTSLAVLLEAGRAPLDKDETGLLYWRLLASGQFAAIRTVRERINRPPLDAPITNGGFGDTEAPEPFQWRLFQKAGIVSEIVEDDLRASNPALRVDYDGYATGTVAEQLTSLAPGTYRFSGEARTETGNPATRLAWTFTCAVGGVALATVLAGTTDPASDGWTTFSGRVDIPEGCPTQWLRLETRAGDRRSPAVAWFDRLAATRIG